MRNLRKKLLLAAALIVIVALGFAGTKAIQAHAVASAARKVSDTFVADVLAGNGTASYALLAPDTKKNMILYTWNNSVADMHSSFAGQQPRYISVDAHPLYRIFTYSITSGGAHYQFRVITSLQDKHWLVQTFTSSLKT